MLHFCHCWTIPCPIYPSIATACVKRLKTCVPEYSCMLIGKITMGYWKFIPVSLCERDWSVLKIVWRDYFCIMLHIVLCSRIPDSVGKDIEKACQSIYPLHDVYVRKVKMLKKPKFECKWYTAMKLARTLDIFFLLLVGARDDKLFRSQMITWLLPIEISWPSLTRGEKKTVPNNWRDF